MVQNYLLNIAIDSYVDSAFKPLNNAVLDAKRLEKTLIEKYDFKLIEDSLFNQDASRKNIIETLNILSAILIDDDNLIINFAGHGSMNQKTLKGYWIPQDASNAISDFIPNSTIIDALAGIDAKHILLIIDSCFSGSFLTQSRSTSGNYYFKLNQSKSRWLISSGRHEKVSDGQPGIGSPFSIILNEFLEKNCTKTFSVAELAVAVTKGTGNISKQQPVFAQIEGIGHEDGQFVFNLNKTSTEQSIVDSALSKIVVSFESASKLKTLEYSQTSLFGYFQKDKDVIVKRSDTLVNFLCSAYTYEEVVEFIPEEIEVDENTYIARVDGYDKLGIPEEGKFYSASVTFQRTFVQETPFMSICKCKGRMVAFSINEEGYYNNLICWGRNQADTAALMIFELKKENKM